MTSNPIPVKKKDIKIALSYVLGEMNRAEVNRAYRLGPNSASGLHRVARAMRQVIQDDHELQKVMHTIRIDLD